jgi:hypothetical protein
LALAACGGAQGEARVLSATIAPAPAAAVEARLALRLTPAMLAALEHGIPLTLELALERRGRGATLALTRQLELGYSPLAGRYRLVDLESGAERSFGYRALLLAALDRVSIPLPRAWTPVASGDEFALRVALLSARLPAPLRLPALFAPEWRIAGAPYRWASPG